MWWFTQRVSRLYEKRFSINQVQKACWMKLASLWSFGAFDVDFGFGTSAQSNPNLRTSSGCHELSYNVVPVKGHRNHLVLHVHAASECADDGYESLGLG